MAQDGPELSDLIHTVGEFLHQLGPRLESQDRYHALCSVYLLGVAERELEHWQRKPAEDDARFAAAVEGGAGLSGEALMRRVCSDIRAGKFDQRMDELMALVETHVVNKVQVSKPEHLAAHHRGEQRRAHPPFKEL